MINAVQAYLAVCLYVRFSLTRAVGLDYIVVNGVIIAAAIFILNLIAVIFQLNPWFNGFQ
jgi:hypothetical protein